MSIAMIRDDFSTSIAVLQRRHQPSERDARFGNLDP